MSLYSSKYYITPICFKNQNISHDEVRLGEAAEYFTAEDDKYEQYLQDIGINENDNEMTIEDIEKILDKYDFKDEVSKVRSFVEEIGQEGEIKPSQIIEYSRLINPTKSVLQNRKLLECILTSISGGKEKIRVNALENSINPKDLQKDKLTLKDLIVQFCGKNKEEIGVQELANALYEK